MLSRARPPIPIQAVSDLSTPLHAGETMLLADSGIVFVCGARPAADANGPRDRLIQYARRHIKGFEFFMAEDVFGTLADADHLNLLAVERVLADYSDCIVMILETASVFAELGAFAADQRVVKKILVINDLEFKAGRSFITLGPLAKIEARSQFSPVIYTDLRCILTAVVQIERSLAKVRRKRDQRVDFSTLDAFESARPKHQALFLRDLIWFFSPISTTDLLQVIRQLYRAAKPPRIDVQLGLLAAMGLAKSDVAGHHSAVEFNSVFFRYGGIDPVRLRAGIINYYHKYCPERVQSMRGRVNVA